MAFPFQRTGSSCPWWLSLSTFPYGLSALLYTVTLYLTQLSLGFPRDFFSSPHFPITLHGEKTALWNFAIHRAGTWHPKSKTIFLALQTTSMSEIIRILEEVSLILTLLNSWADYCKLLTLQNNQAGSLSAVTGKGSIAQHWDCTHSTACAATVLLQPS